MCQDGTVKIYAMLCTGNLRRRRAPRQQKFATAVVVVLLVIVNVLISGVIATDGQCRCADEDGAATASRALSLELQQLTLQEFAVDQEIRRLHSALEGGHGQRKLLQIFYAGSTSRRACSCASKCLDAHGSFVKSCAQCLAGDPTQNTYSSMTGNCRGSDCAGGGCEVDLFQCGMPRCMYERNNELTKAQIDDNGPIRDPQGYGNPTGPFG